MVFLTPTGRQTGFSLVELMVVVGIIGILVSLAMPQFDRMISKARQAEGKSNLSYLHGLEIAYYAESGVYVDVARTGRVGCNVNDLGFQVTGCGAAQKARYDYDVQVGVTTNLFAASAIAGRGLIVRGCGVGPTSTTGDYWILDQNNLLTPIFNAIKQCP